MDEKTVPTDLLTLSSHRTWRITGTRVSLDTVVAAFWAGSTAEQICQDFPSLSLAQAYRSIGYYLSHLGVGRSLSQGAEQLRQALEKRFSDRLIGLRQRLLAHRHDTLPTSV